MNSATLRTAPLPARGKLYGMRVVFALKRCTIHRCCREYGHPGACEVDETMVELPARAEWTVLDRHPAPGHWWLHRRDALDNWVTTFARYSQLEQVIE